MANHLGSSELKTPKTAVVHFLWGVKMRGFE